MGGDRGDKGDFSLLSPPLLISPFFTQDCSFFGSPVVSGDLICVGGHGLWTLPRLWKTPETPGERGV